MNDWRFLFSGSETCPPGHEYGGIRDYYLLHVITGGKGEYQCGGRRWSLAGDDAFLIFPGEKHLYRADIKEPWSYFWIGFSGSFTELFTSLRLLPENPVLRGSDSSELQMIFSGITEPRMYRHPAEELENRGRVQLILGKLLRNRRGPQAVPRRSDSRISHHVHSMEAFINEYFDTPVQVQDIIDFVQLERSYASRIFREATGRSIGVALRDRRFRQAELCLQDGWSVKETAYSCGFRDYNNFLKAFRKRTGRTPTAWKLDFSSP
ncbi:MAG: AraC family transcriptional regulator [Spirochaetales bacterium]|nr:AraC family transcriptional regulator [Spirochaetales bacterium]